MRRLTRQFERHFRSTTRTVMLSGGFGAAEFHDVVFETKTGQIRRAKER